MEDEIICTANGKRLYKKFFSHHLNLGEIGNKNNKRKYIFKYWIATFESFLQAVETGQGAIDPSVEVNRRGLLVNFLTTSAYQYIEDCETYEAAVAELKRVYVKTKNNVFARHLLATRRQLPGESLQQFLQVLKTLSKDCSFRAVTTEQYRWELVRDAFINGLASAAV